MPCRVWVASDLPRVAPRRALVSTAGLTFLLLKSSHFLSSPSFSRLASAVFEASGVKLPIWFARLIAAIIFIALVASAIHFLATSSALTKTYRNPPDRNSRYSVSFSHDLKSNIQVSCNGSDGSTTGLLLKISFDFFTRAPSSCKREPA